MTHDQHFSTNMSRLHGYLGASIKNLSSELESKQIKAADAAEQLKALYNTMEWVWKMRYDAECADNIRFQFIEEMAEIRRNKKKK